MRRFGILLVERSEGWDLLSLSPDARSETLTGREPIDIATRTIAFAEEHALNSGKIVIALASESVLFASLSKEVAIDINSNPSLRYALEALLPVDAESIVADSIRDTQNGLRAAVCVEVDRLKPLVNALEQLRGRVQFIVPISILTWEQALAENKLTSPSVSIWSLEPLAGEKQVELFVQGEDKQLLDWRVSGADAMSLRSQLLQLRSESMPILLCGTEAEIQDMSNCVMQDTRSIEIDRAELLRRRANLILSGRELPCMDLRRDDLAIHDPLRRDRKSLVRLGLATGLFVASLCTALLWQANTYQRAAEQYKKLQLELFRATFPTQRAPSAILGRLKSEHTKAKGIRKTDPDTALPQSALQTLHQIVTSLSNDFPYEIDDIRIENGRITIEIEMLSQQDTGRVVSALARQGFDVEPPSTTLVDGDRVLAKINAIASTAVAMGEFVDEEKGKR